MAGHCLNKRVGFFIPIMCIALAHEAQWAACAQRTAHPQPKTSPHGQRCDVSRVRRILVWDLPQQRAHCFPQAFIVCQNVISEHRRMRNVWLALGLAVCQHWRSCSLGIVCHNRLFLLMRSCSFSYELLKTRWECPTPKFLKAATRSHPSCECALAPPLLCSTFSITKKLFHQAQNVDVVQ